MTAKEASAITNRESWNPGFHACQRLLKKVARSGNNSISISRQDKAWPSNSAVALLIEYGYKVDVDEGGEGVTIKW